MSFLTYSKSYVDDAQQFYQSIKDRTVVPHQIEFQPGSSSSKICWMECPHCYGINTEHSQERLSLDRYHELLDECASIPKVIFSGYATDPFFYKDIVQLIAHARDNAQIIGMHTKLLKIPRGLHYALMDAPEESYISVSLDAYDDSMPHWQPTAGGSSQSHARILDKMIGQILLQLQALKAIQLMCLNICKFIRVIASIATSLACLERGTLLTLFF